MSTLIAVLNVHVHRQEPIAPSIVIAQTQVRPLVKSVQLLEGQLLALNSTEEAKKDRDHSTN